MTEAAFGDPEMHSLRRIVDAELQQAETGADPVGEDEAELQQYLTRLRVLRDAIVAMEAYEGGLGEP
jgi:hypothetical protein